MKKILYATCGIAIAVSLFGGCTRQNDLTPIDEVYVQPSNITEEEAAENNAKITDSDVNLVQWKAAEDQNAEIAVISTSLGDITVLLYREYAPLAVENFVKHANEGYYDGVIFHRVVNNFMIQSGDPLGTGAGGESVYNGEDGSPKPFEDEFSLDLWHFRGALSMAGNGANSNDSQFFIVQAPFVTDDVVESMENINFPDKVIDQYQQDGGMPNLDWKHTVFGQVIDGMDVVDEIAKTEVDPQTNKPLEDVVINSIKVTGSPEEATE